MPLIVLEGIDGCGKGTQLARLIERLAANGRDPVVLREPGGTALGERVRELLLDPATEAAPSAELLAYQVARAQLVHERLRPALAAGQVVVLDRFWYSTIAYQAYGLELDERQVRAAIRLAIGDLAVDCALLLRVSVETSLARRITDTADRIEARGRSYLERVHAGYEALVAEGALTAIDAERERDAVAQAVWTAVRTVVGC